MTAMIKIEPYWIHKERVLRRDGERCGICSEPIDLRLGRPNPGSFTIDHIRPRSLGGCDHLMNLRPAHLGCNSRRGNRVDRWLKCHECFPPSTRTNGWGPGTSRYLRPEELRPAPVVNAADGKTWDISAAASFRRPDAPRAIPGHCAPVPTEPPKRKPAWRRRAVGSHLWPRSRGGLG